MTNPLMKQQPYYVPPFAGPIGSKPIIPPGKQYWIAVAWLRPSWGSRIIRQPFPYSPTCEPSPTLQACCWRQGGESEVNAAWDHMYQLGVDDYKEGTLRYQPQTSLARCWCLRWAVYVAPTPAQLFGVNEDTLVNVRARILNDWIAEQTT